MAKAKNLLVKAKYLLANVKDLLVKAKNLLVKAKELLVKAKSLQNLKYFFYFYLIDWSNNVIDLRCFRSISKTTTSS